MSNDDNDDDNVIMFPVGNVVATAHGNPDDDDGDDGDDGTGGGGGATGLMLPFIAPAGAAQAAGMPMGPNPAQNPAFNLDPNWMAKRVWAIRYHKTFNADQKQRIIYNFIWAHENGKTSTGCAWIRLRDSTKTFLFDGRRARLYVIDPGNPEFTGYLWNTYGLWSSEPLTKRLIGALRDGAMSVGLVRDVRRFSYWDRLKQLLYISTYDGHCYQITGDVDVTRGVTCVPNGTGSAIFLDDDRGSTPADPCLGNNRALFTHLIDDLQYVPTSEGGMSPQIQKTCLGIWLFAIAFPDLLPTKPILLLEGDRGSGKTAAAQRIALALHGKYMPIQVPKQEDKDFGVKILRSPMTILDDVNEPVDWLRDTLCTYATGGGWTRRALYTDDAEHVIKPESFLTITTNNPTTFRQGQVADRLLILRLERRQERAGYLGADTLFERIRANRDEIFGEWLMWLNEIVAELRRNTAAVTTKSRMADFAHLAHVIGRVLARPGGPAGDWSPEAIEEMLDMMQTERNSLVIENDPLVELLDRWLDHAPNQGREIKINDLHRELAALAKLTGTTTFRSPKALASRLRETGNALTAHFVLDRRTGHGGAMMYTFRRAVD
jgi:hypothetical protein